MNDAGKRLIAAAKEAALTALRAHLDALEAERDALLMKNAALSAELAEANAALAWCLAMPPEDVSDANPAVWKAWLSKQPAGYGQAVTRATTPPLAEPPAG